MLRYLSVLLVMLAIAISGGVIAYHLLPQSHTPGNSSLPGVVQLQNEIGGKDFTLIRHDGVSVTARDFYGQYLLIYFGYSFCPDICPTSLIQMLRAWEKLPKEQQDILTPVMVSIDPERDTPKELAAYVADFHPQLIGLSGDIEAVKAMLKQYKVFARKTGSAGDLQNATYLMDHSSFFYLVKPDGSFSHLLSSHISDKALHQTLSAIVRTPLVVEGASARASIGNIPYSAAYGKLRNTTEEALRLIGAEIITPKRAGGRVDIHQTVENDGVFSMRPLNKGIVIPAKGEITLAPKSFHLMLSRLEKKLISGTTLTLRFLFAKGASQIVNFPVRDVESAHKHSAPSS